MDILNNDIIDKLRESGRKIYLVGGTVRDSLLNRKTYDRDLIVLDEDARVFSEKLAKVLDATFIPLDEQNKIYRLVLKDKVNYLDITNPIENDLDKDLLRRDFTINALAMDIYTGEVLDKCGGKEDLLQGVIRMISEKNFDDDPLRILRAYRFQAGLGFEIEPVTLKAIEKRVSEIYKPAIERINVEILKLFEGKYTVKALFALDKVGLLEKLFPPIIDVKKVPPNSHHHLDLLHHSIEVVNQIQLLYEEADEEVKKELEKSDFGGASRLAHIKLVGLLHDIGKFSTWTIEENDRHRFLKHDDVGSKMAEKMLKDMNFSKKQIEYISKQIKLHIYPSGVLQAPNLSEKHYMRYIRKMEGSVVDNIILAKADRLSALGKDITKEILESNLTGLDRMLGFYLDIKDNLQQLPKLLDGNEVMKMLKIKPSPLLGQVMEALHEAQISGDVMTKDDAIKFVEDFGNKL